MQLKYLLVFVISFSGFHVLAQNKFGKVDPASVSMKYYSNDSSAEAVILSEVGEIKFTYNNEKGFQSEFTVHRVIKILTKEGLSWGDHVIDLWDGNNGKEKIIGMKGFTYNLTDGKLEKVKLEKASIFEEQVNDNLYRTKITMPVVKEGSVVEYTYSVISSYWFNLAPWEFQHEVPVVYSSMTTKIPEYFNFSKITKGYYPLSKHETTQRSTSLNYISVSEVGGRNQMGTTTERTAQTITFTEHQDVYVLENVPALRPESYISTPKNYTSGIIFELQSTKFPGGQFRDYRSTWSALNSKFIESEFFGKQISRNGHLKSIADEIKSNAGSEQEKVLMAYNHIQRTLKWNGYHGLYVNKSIKKAYEEGTGNVSDINMNLVALLRLAGVGAYPVLTSTRSNGFVRENFPISDQFNYVIVLVPQVDGNILLDASQPGYPAGTLAPKCINGNGWKVAENGGGWVSLAPIMGAKKTIMTEVAFSDEGLLDCKISKKSEGYDAYGNRSYVLTKGEEDYVKTFTEKLVNWNVKNYAFQNKENLDQPFVEDIETVISDAYDQAGNQIYINPLLGEALKENPFKSAERNYPIEFIYNRAQLFATSIAIPEGYDIDEIPAPANFMLPGRKATFMYNCAREGNQIKMTCVLDIKQPLFLPEDYITLKEFFSKVVEKQNEQIVLKRI